MSICKAIFPIQMISIGFKHQDLVSAIALRPSKMSGTAIPTVTINITITVIRCFITPHPSNRSSNPSPLSTFTFSVYICPPKKEVRLRRLNLANSQNSAKKALTKQACSCYKFTQTI